MARHTVALRDWTPKDYPVRLSGHSLVSEGSPRFKSTTCERNPECWEYRDKLAAGETERADRLSYSGYNDGHARCTCGAESPHLPTQGKRKAWHKDHKRELAAGTSPDPAAAEAPPAPGGENAAGSD